MFVVFCRCIFSLYRRLSLHTKYALDRSLRKTLAEPVADTEGEGGPCPPPLEADVQTLPLQKSVESEAGKRDF